MKGEIEMNLFDYEYDYKFEYMMLSRLEMDCKYFLGYGNKNKRQLRATYVTYTTAHSNAGSLTH